mmetsp:Transcript_11806/g.14465  ORF Transcript_11806/g.14465 Transcript_11806/m.14465 type:complete len:107 (-) Transcript_11806:39-359(-)
MHLDKFKRTRWLAAKLDIDLCRLAMPMSRSLVDMVLRSFKLSQQNSTIASFVLTPKLAVDSRVRRLASVSILDDMHHNRSKMVRLIVSVDIYTSKYISPIRIIICG